MADETDVERLFAEAMQDVAPLEQRKRAERKTGVTVTDAHLARRDAALGIGEDKTDPNFLTPGEVPPRQPLEYLEWKKDGVQNAVYDNLRRGQYALDAHLDLHGKTVKEARAEVFVFLKKASASDWRNLVIAHGKGERSATPGRMKSYVAAWLEQHPEVMAFCSAQRQHGGVGATYVLLRKSPAGKEANREQHGLKSDPEAGR